MPLPPTHSHRMGRNARTLLATSITLGVLSACATQQGPLQLVASKTLESASEPPQITAVVDLGSIELAADRPVMVTAGNGRAVVGELLLVRGSHFGRQPRVTVDDQPAALAGRTNDGGVIVRVPWGVGSGKRTVRLSTALGQGIATYPLQRYALATVPSKDLVIPLDVTRDGAQAIGEPLSVANAHLVRYGTTGHVAFIGGMNTVGALTMTPVDLVDSSGPRAHASLEVPGKELLALATAERAPVAVIVTDSHVVFFDARTALRPARYQPIPLQKDLLDRVVAADLGPEGHLLAVLLRHNELRLYAVRQRSALTQLASIGVLPRAHAPLVRRVRFASDGRALWVISGDNPDSLRSGRFPLRLTVIRIQDRQVGRTRAFGMLSVWRAIDVPHRAAPVDLVVARGQPTATGQTVAVPPQNAAVFITAHDSKLLALRKTRFNRKRGLRRAVRILRGIDPLGTLVRTDLEGKGGPMFTSPSLLGAVDITSDSQLLLVAGARVKAHRRPAKVTLVYGVTTYRVFAKHDSTFIPLAEVDPETIARPFMLGDVRVQP